FTWTYRIAANLCLDVSRKKGRGERVEIDEADADIEAHMDPPSAAFAGPERGALNVELKEKIDEALAGLSENHRAILLLRELDGLAEHLSDCPACTRRKLLLVAQGDALRERAAARAREADLEGVADAVLARVDREGFVRPPFSAWGTEMWGAHRAALSAGAGIALAGCLALALFLAPQRTSPVTLASA